MQEPLIKTLYISKINKQWKVHWANEESGIIYTLRSIAIAAARKMVAKLPPGDCFQIRIQKHNGEYITAWTYGIDPFPSFDKEKRF
jgi:hypothetical protein